MALCRDKGGEVWAFIMTLRLGIRTVAAGFWLGRNAVLYLEGRMFGKWEHGDSPEERRPPHLYGHYTLNICNALGALVLSLRWFGKKVLCDLGLRE